MVLENSLYRNYAEHLKEKYREKVYKLPVNLPGTCPNRDGTVGYGGCIFCDEEGSGFECLSNSLSVQKQISKNKAFFQKRFNAQKFVAYFQAFTNTYMPLAEFKQNVLAAVADKDIVGISISTRPDCIHESYLQFLTEVCREVQEKEGRKLDVSIELGLQTANYHTLQKINRGHTLAEYLDAVIQIKKHNFSICTHIILNLPWDDENDVIENAKIMSALKIDYIKLHSLYVVKGTVLDDLYQKGEFQLISLDEYTDRVILFLEHLAPEIVVQRLVGKGPQGQLSFCNWNTSWWKIKQMIEDKMVERKTYQGKRCDYLNGKALTKKLMEE